MTKSIDRRITINGSAIRIRASSEQEYAKKVIELARNITTNETIEPVPFREYAMNWFNTFSKPNIESATAVTYERQLKNIWIPAFSDRDIRSIKPSDIQSCFNDMTCAKETKYKARTVLNMVFEQAMEDGLIDKNPLMSKSIRITGRSARDTEPYSVDQMRFLASHIELVRSEQDRLFLSFMLFHPLRLEEVLGLRVEDINKENMTFTISRSVTHPTRNAPEVKTAKTEASARTLSLSKSTASLINNNAQGYIIGGDKPLSYTQVRRMCDRIMCDTNFSDTITPRRFRTTVLTDIYDTTKDIKCAQLAAGHTTAAMTLKHYVKGRSSSSNAASAVTNLYTSN